MPSQKWPETRNPLELFAWFLYCHTAKETVLQHIWASENWVIAAPGRYSPQMDVNAKLSHLEVTDGRRVVE